MNTAEVVLAVVNSIVAIVAGGAVPFAISVASRLSRIEAMLGNGLRSDVTEIKTRCTAHANEFAKAMERLIRLEEHQ